MPPSELPPSPAVGRAISTTPARPSSRPTTCLACGARRARAAATMVTKIGVPPLSMPVTLDDTCCSANGKSDSGMAIQIVPSRMIRQRSAPVTRVRRAAGKRPSVRKPRPTRSGVTTAAGKPSSASAMKKNEVPHTAPGSAQRAQSAPVIGCTAGAGGAAAVVVTGPRLRGRGRCAERISDVHGRAQAELRTDGARQPSGGCPAPAERRGVR